MNDAKTAPASSTEQVTPETLKTPETLDPNTHLHQWLRDNNYQIQVEALTENNPFVDGKGFVLTDKPLLVVTVKKKETK